MHTELTVIGHTPVLESSQTTRPETKFGQVRILLIEDNPGDARLIRFMLEEEAGFSFELEWVDRLKAGLARLRDSSFGLVLADLSLPDSYGLETFQQLHAEAPRLPIIVLSGLRDTTVAVQAVHEGAQDFLIKGQVNGQLLVRAIRYAIERKHLTEQLGRYAEELRSKNAQLEADFNMAREIQQIFLPQQYPVIPSSAAPEASALRFSHRYLPAAAVGGDFFDVLEVGPSAAGVLICDVMGHSMRAALVTAIMRGLVEELMSIAPDAGKFIAEINRSLHAILRRTREPFLATAFYMVADVGLGEIQYCTAGHPSPFRVQRSEGKVTALKSWDPRHGPALGLFEKPEYPIGHCPMALGDLFLLFTDGIYEPTNSQGQEFGRERFLAAVQNHMDLPTEKLFDLLIEEAQHFAKRSVFDDDVCLVGMEVGGVGTGR